MMEKDINYYSVNWDSTKEIAKDREHCKIWLTQSKSINYSVMLLAH